MNLRLNANAVITNNEGKILVVKLKKGPFEGKLSIPGGGVNSGELCFETVKREVEEETGIKTLNPIIPFGFCELLRDSIKSHRVVLLLEAKGEGTLKESEEAIPKWVDFKELENDKELIDFAKQSLKIWKSGEKHFTIVE